MVSYYALWGRCANCGQEIAAVHGTDYSIASAASLQLDPLTLSLEQTARPLPSNRAVQLRLLSGQHDAVINAYNNWLPRSRQFTRDMSLVLQRLDPYHSN